MSDRIVRDVERASRAGRARRSRIYERPATRFVAGFIGDANLMEAVVEGADGDGLVARVGDRVSGPSQAGNVRAPGSPLCVRPERVRVAPPRRAGGRPDRSRGGPRLPGRVVKYRLALPWAPPPRRGALRARDRAFEVGRRGGGGLGRRPGSDGARMRMRGLAGRRPADARPRA